MTDPLRQFVLSSGTGTDAMVISLLDTMAFGDVERFLHRYGSANALRQRRLAERDAAIRAIASDCAGIGGRELAREIVRRLGRYAASAWRFERDQRPSGNPARARLHRALSLNGGNPPSFSMAWRALAGGVS
jgi:hypothetical protein